MFNNWTKYKDFLKRLFCGFDDFLVNREFLKKVEKIPNLVFFFRSCYETWFFMNF